MGLSFGYGPATKKQQAIALIRTKAVANQAEGALGYVDGALFQGLVTEAQAAFNGTWH